MTLFRILASGALAVGVLAAGIWFYYERIANHSGVARARCATIRPTRR